MTIKIAHLYYNLNDKSENYNIEALKKFNTLENIKTEIYVYKINDKINFEECDLYYIGNIKNEHLKVVEKDLTKYKEQIINSIEKKKHFLLTGSSIKIFENLNILPIITKKIKEQSTIFKSNIIKEPLIGTYNLLINNNIYFNYKNFYAFTITDPLLIKNPYLTKYIIKNITRTKNKFFKWQINNDITEIKAYKETLNI